MEKRRIIVNLENGGISSVSGLPEDVEIELRDFDVPADYDGPDRVNCSEGSYQRIILTNDGEQG